MNILLLAWVVPSITVFYIVALMVLTDNGPVYKLRRGDLFGLGLLSIIWPIGVVFIIAMFVDRFGYE